MVTYRICVQGHFDENWAAQFGLRATSSVHADEPQPSTTWTCVFVDQAALFGALRHMNELGLELLLVERIGEY